MALRINNPLRSGIGDAISKCLSGTGGIAGTSGTAGVLKVYTTPQPGTAGVTSGTCTMIVELSPLSWAAGSNGTCTLSASRAGTAVADGTAAWARLSDYSGTGYILDGSCGTAAACDFVIDSTVISSGAVVTLTAATIVQPAS